MIIMLPTQLSPIEIILLPYRVRLDREERWLIWQGGEPDTVVTDEPDTIPTFATLDELQHYASSRGIVVQPDDDPWCVDLDCIAHWLRDPQPDAVDCVQFLLGWNLFGDVATAFGQPLRDRDATANRAYSKLFWANNLPAVTPVGRYYEPVWKTTELVRMRQVLSRGLEQFRNATKVSSHSSDR
jgi:hypothetical protein